MVELDLVFLIFLKVILEVRWWTSAEASCVQLLTPVSLLSLMFIPVQPGMMSIMMMMMILVLSPDNLLGISRLLRGRQQPCDFHPFSRTTDVFSSTVKVLRGRELMGAQRFTSINPVNNYARMFLHRRLLGHLSAVYCVAFDRTGLRIFTVSETPQKAELRAARLKCLH